MAEKEKFYITTPIYYPSGNPHIGHCYTTVACDSIARFRRMQGKDVIFLTGTDEHGLKIEQKAKEKGITPKEYVDEIVKVFKKLWSYMNISYDRYIRTTDDYHIETVQKIFKELYDKGYIYKGSRIINWCPVCKTSLSDAEVEHEEQDGFFWHINYPVVGEEGRFVEIATTRPETLFGDTAVAVNPDDERYQDIVGKMLKLPMTDREIPVIADPYVCLLYTSPSPRD